MGTRENIVAAAARIMRTEGYARATTKEIARAAGYSEATLYKHFQDKTEIFLTVLSEQLPGLGTLLDELIEQAGTRTVRANLADVAATAIEFYTESFPIAGSLFSSQRFLTTHRERLSELDAAAGPHRPIEQLAAYLRAEQRLGRVRADADADAAAFLLIGACFQRAFLFSFAGEQPFEEQRRDIATALAETLLGGLSATD